jgi:hypothetical protein
MSFSSSSVSSQDAGPGRDVAEQWGGDSAGIRSLRSPGLSDQARDDWVKSLQAFMNRRGMPLLKVPMIAG